MTRIKLCGLSSVQDIEAANALKPEYIGFVFVPASRRYVSFQKAAELKKLLDKEIRAVGVFADESPDVVAELLNAHVIDIAQLHGTEDATYIRKLRVLTEKPLIQAFQVKTEADIKKAGLSAADHILLDSGAGTGETFDWNISRMPERPFFLAGGLTCENVGKAVSMLHPFAVDVSSGVESGGVKDRKKMAAFVEAVRKEGGR